MNKIAVLLVFLISLTTFAQQQQNETNTSEINQSSSFSFRRTIQLDEQKKTEEIIIEIEKQTKRFDLSIETSVTSGKLTIELYDSNEKKQGTFSVGTQLNTRNSERAQGTINKSLIDPQAGNWIVKIISLNAKGMIQISTDSLL